jgi:hypothetical protein
VAGSSVNTASGCGGWADKHKLMFIIWFMRVSWYPSGASVLCPYVNFSILFGSLVLL